MSIKKDLIKYTPRKEQDAALNYIKNVCEKKPDNKFFLLNMPVGIGKSHLAVMISDYMTTEIIPGGKVDIVTAGKLLQDQYEDTYEQIKSLRGKDNYNCNQYETSCANGAEFNRLNKTKCEECPYNFAKESYLGCQVGLSNFHLYLIHNVYELGGRVSEILIIDEAHQFDDVMTNFISIKVTETQIKKFHLTNEEAILKKLDGIVNIETYIDFLKELSEEFMGIVVELNKFLGDSRTGMKNSANTDKRELKISAITGIEYEDVKFMKLVKEIIQFSSKLEFFLREYEEDENNWILERYFNEKTNKYELALEPIWVDKFLEKFIWSKYEKVFLMSGTILNKSLFAKIAGIDPEKSVYYSANSPFDVSNRKIYYMPLGKMSFSKKEQTFTNFIPFFEKLVKRYPEEKGIIHTNSFELANWIKRDFKNKRFIYHDSNDKEDKLRHHFESPEPTVIVSPSVSTGVSFDHEKSRFQVVAKIPYPSLASQRNKARQKMNPEWYSWRTVCDIIQACGRSVRSYNDYADTIIIDSSFGDVLRYSSHHFPSWFVDSIKTIKK